MTAPNLRLPVTIVGKTVLYSCTASLASVLANPGSSNKLFRVTVARAANVTTALGKVDLTIYRGSTHTYQVKSADVPPGESLVIIDRNEFAYLEEGDAIYAKANAVSTIDLTIHYEDIS